MKIVHIYAQNLDVFAEAVRGTDCRLNASVDLDYLMNSIQNYNARDVLGLIVFANPMTKKCLRLIQKFDQYFIYQRMPVIVISDTVNELYSQGYLKVKNSALYLVESEGNTISDIDIDQIFTTLLANSGEVYDLSACKAERSKRQSMPSGFEVEDTMSDSLRELLDSLEGRVLNEDCTGERRTIFSGAEQEGKT